MMLVSTVLVAGPAFGLLGGDDFPLSTYPMFAADRGTVVVVPTAVGALADGEEVLLSPTLIGGSAWPNLALRTVGRAVQGGAHSAVPLCDEIAARVASDPEHAQVVAVEITREHYDSREYFGGQEAPRRRELIARCNVP